MKQFYSLNGSTNILNHSSRVESNSSGFFNLSNGNMYTLTFQAIEDNHTIGKSYDDTIFGSMEDDYITITLTDARNIDGEDFLKEFDYEVIYHDKVSNLLKDRYIAFFTSFGGDGINYDFKIDIDYTAEVEDEEGNLVEEDFTSTYYATDLDAIVNSVRNLLLENGSINSVSRIEIDGIGNYSFIINQDVYRLDPSNAMIGLNFDKPMIYFLGVLELAEGLDNYLLIDYE